MAPSPAVHPRYPRGMTVKPPNKGEVLNRWGFYVKLAASAGSGQFSDAGRSSGAGATATVGASATTVDSATEGGAAAGAGSEGAPLSSPDKSVVSRLLPRRLSGTPHADDYGVDDDDDDDDGDDDDDDADDRDSPSPPVASISTLPETGTPTARAARAAELRLENLRLAKWRAMRDSWASFTRKHPRKVTSRIRKGVPDAMRGEMWQLMTGSRARLNADPSMYGTLASRDDVPHGATIDRDIARTFPSHCMFRDPDAGGQAALRNVLRAYSVQRPEVGYCQGMAFIAGLLLVYLPEHEAFHLFDTLMTAYGAEGMFRPGLPRFLLMTYQFQQLLQRKLPKLARHLDAEGVHASMYASRWFVTLFAYNSPFALVTRVWDIFMWDGANGKPWKIIFRVALALLKLGQKELMTMDFEELLPHIKRLPAIVDADKVLSTALGMRVTSKQLQDLEARYAKEGM